MTSRQAAQCETPEACGASPTYMQAMNFPVHLPHDAINESFSGPHRKRRGNFLKSISTKVLIVIAWFLLWFVVWAAPQWIWTAK